VFVSKRLLIEQSWRHQK